MKWIKLFEGFDKDDYYQEIDGSVIFTEDDESIHLPISEKLKKAFKSWFVDRPLECVIREWVITVKTSDSWLQVFEVSDEYYHIQIGSINKEEHIDHGRSLHYTMTVTPGISRRVGNIIGIRFYKCDQIEGIKKLLKDKGVL